jgi:hypothetical protein
MSKQVVISCGNKKKLDFFFSDTGITVWLSPEDGLDRSRRTAVELHNHRWENIKF